MGTAKSNPALGLLSAFMTYAFLVAVAALAGLNAGICRDLVLLVSGRVDAIAHGSHDIGTMGLTIVTVIVLELPFAIVTALAMNALIGKSHGEHAVGELLDTLTHGHNFMSFFGLVLLEELGARWLFLGALPWLGLHISWLSFLTGTAAFYALFLLGNGLWAYIHLENYRKTGDRNPLRVLSQFVGGIFYTYVFVKYGLLAAILTHFGSNAVLFALHKRQRLGVMDGLITLYSAVCAFSAWRLLDKPLSDAGAWLRPSPTFALPGWEFWDYLWLSVLIGSSLNVAFSVMLYDRGDAGKALPTPADDKAKQPGFLMTLVILPVGLGIVVGLLYGVYGILGLLIADTPTRVLLVAILFSLIHKGASGSAVARTFWIGLPGMFVTVCVLQALGFWHAIGYIGASMVVSYPLVVMHRNDD